MNITIENVMAELEKDTVVRGEFPKDFILIGEAGTTGIEAFVHKGQDIEKYKDGVIGSLTSVDLISTVEGVGKYSEDAQLYATYDGNELVALEVHDDALKTIS